jgi:UDP-GlcNAc:undecaprenyl-phosphate GlcNAc-1-phosphate transferase
MMNSDYISFTIYLIAYFILIYFYFKIAFRYRIIDKPNERSSHIKSTIRGAGILFPIAALIPFIYYDNPLNHIYFILGLLLISIISFLDDAVTLKNQIRFICHFIAVSLLLAQLNFYQFNVIYILPAFIVVIGVINAYNFMDGINGIHAIYSFVSVCTIYYLNHKFNYILPDSLFLSLIPAIIVFGYYNIRKKARCFSGDVGSISIAFIISYMILILILNTGDIKWIFLLAIYGIDSVSTITLRLSRKENIFKAHRSHFYQYLANEKGISQINISLIYSLLQILFNIILIITSVEIYLSVFLVILMSYILLRLKYEGYQKLFVNYM